MKKFLLTLAVMAMAVPAMAADIDFTATDNGDGSFTISYVATTAPRGVALTIDTDGATIGDAVGGENGDVLSMDAAFNCYMDYANMMELDTPGSYTVGAGHPLASQTQAGLPTFPASSFSVCMGVLDQGGGQAAGPLTSTDLITLQLSGAAVVDIAADTYRSESGAVGSTLTTNLPIQVTVTDGPTTCITSADGSLYDEWVAAGSPDCWCYPTQCKGDADGLKEGVTYYTTGYYVGTNDLNIMAAAWKKDDATLATVENGACADFDHLKEGVTYYTEGYRVGTNDLNIMAENWKIDPIATDCYPGNVSP